MTIVATSAQHSRPRCTGEFTTSESSGRSRPAVADDVDKDLETEYGPTNMIGGVDDWQE